MAVVKPLVAPRVSTEGPNIPAWSNDPTMDSLFGQYLQPPTAPVPVSPITNAPTLQPYQTSQPGASYLDTWRQTAIADADADRANSTNASIYDKQMKQYNDNIKAIAGAGGGGGGGAGGSWGKGTGSGMGVSAYGWKGNTGVAGTKGSGYMGMQPEFWNRLQAAFNDMQKAGLGKPGVTDGWRSLAAQYDVKRRKGNLAATPGRSIHGLGLAADLNLNPRQQRWLEANAGRYGIRRLQSEAWHWQLLPALWNNRNKGNNYVSPQASRGTTSYYSTKQTG